jgi:hypothetical protein
MDNGVADIGFMGFRSDQDAPRIATARPCADKLVILSMKQNNMLDQSRDLVWENGYDDSSRPGQHGRSAAEGFERGQVPGGADRSPEWAKQLDLSITVVMVDEYAAIQRHRDKLLRAVHREVDAYMNSPELYGEGESFPDRLRMTGAYYLGSESYIAHRDPAWF